MICNVCNALVLDKPISLVGALPLVNASCWGVNIPIRNATSRGLVVGSRRLTHLICVCKSFMHDSLKTLATSSRNWFALSTQGIWMMYCKVFLFLGYQDLLRSSLAQHSKAWVYDHVHFPPHARHSAFLEVLSRKVDIYVHRINAPHNNVAQIKVLC